MLHRFILFMYMSVYMYTHMYVHACRGQKGILDPLELELLRLVNFPTWVPDTKLESYVRAIKAFNCWSISLYISCFLSVHSGVSKEWRLPSSEHWGFEWAAEDWFVSELQMKDVSWEGRNNASDQQGPREVAQQIKVLLCTQRIGL